MTTGAPPAGPSFLRSRLFRLLYLPLALLYLGVTLFWGRHDLVRVHREYRLAAARVASGQAQAVAGREVAGGCAQAAGGETAPGYGACLQASAHLVEARAAVLGAELRGEKQRALRKMWAFYGLVLGMMVLVPLALLYLFLAFLLHLPANIRLRKE